MITSINSSCTLLHFARLRLFGLRILLNIYLIEIDISFVEMATNNQQSFSI